MNEINDKEFLATLAKGLTVINAFGARKPTLTVSEAASAANVSRATARRILHTLLTLGYVRQEGREFSLLPKTLELGFRFLSTQSWIDRATELLKQLSNDVDESCSAAILQGAEIVYVAHVPSRRIMTIDESVGTRLPAFHTAMGRIHLGCLSDDELWARLKSVRMTPYTSGTIVDLRGLYDRIRADHLQGFSIVDEELEKGLRSLAVPVRDRAGDIFAAINLSANSTRTTRDYLRAKLLPQLQAVATQISQPDAD